MVKIRKLFRTYQGLITSLSILLGVGAGVLWGIIPMAQKILFLRSATSALIKQNQILRVKTGILESIDEATYKQNLVELALAVPPDKSVTSVFSTIDGLGSLTGVSLSDFTLTKPGALASESAARLSAEEKQIGSNLLPFTLTVSGTYEQIHEFFTQVIRVRRFFRVKRFDIFFESAGRVSAKLVMDAFYAPLPTQLGSADQPVEPLGDQDDKTIIKVAGLTVLSQDASLQIPQGGPLSPTTSSRDDPFAP